MPLDWRSHTGLLLPFAYVEFVFDSEVYNETNLLNQQSSNSQQINQLEKPAGKMITVKASWETIFWGGDSACESSFNIQRDQLLKQSALSLNDCCIQYVTIWPRVERCRFSDSKVKETCETTLHVKERLHVIYYPFVMVCLRREGTQRNLCCLKCAPFYQTSVRSGKE